jgi:release factor glutamine methyltransferase
VKTAANPAEPVAARAQSEDLRGALGGAMARLESDGVPSAPLAAELLLIYVLGRDRVFLYAHPEYALDVDQAARFARLIEQRAAGMPVQYLTGRQEFWGLEFEVNPSVLIPRPETEHVVEVALARLGARRGDALTVADVGTGSGCLAVALARELPQARIIATDISPAALEVARRNAARHGVASRVEFCRANFLRTYLADSGPTKRCFDLIVSNPPYIGLDEAASLPREVREHEPHEALFAGPEGNDAYPRLIAQAEGLLRGGGWLVVELGHRSAPRVASLLETAAWAHLAVERDLAGIDRVLSAQRVARA